MNDRMVQASSAGPNSGFRQRSLRWPNSDTVAGQQLHFTERAATNSGLHVGNQGVAFVLITMTLGRHVA
jgi:hypothetical protein